MNITIISGLQMCPSCSAPHVHTDPSQGSDSPVRRAVVVAGVPHGAAHHLVYCAGHKPRRRVAFRKAWLWSHCDQNDGGEGVEWTRGGLGLTQF